MSSATAPVVPIQPAVLSTAVIQDASSNVESRDDDDARGRGRSDSIRDTSAVSFRDVSNDARGRGRSNSLRDMSALSSRDTSRATSRLNLSDEPEAVSRSTLKSVAIVSSISGTYFMSSFFSGALAVSLPTIQKDLNISTSNLQWSTSTYSLSYGSFLLIFGRLADIYSPRILFLAGTAFYSALSVAVALAPDWQSFTALCCLLGLGASANTPAGVGVLGRYFEPGDAKNRAFACLGAGQPLGYLSGLVIGALLTETKLRWRASFTVQASLSLAFFVIGWFSIPSSFSVSSASIPLAPVDPTTGDVKSFPVDSPENKRLDWIGALLSIAGLTMLVFSISDAAAEPKGWSTPFIPPLLAVSVLFLIAFHFWTVRMQRQLVRYYAKTPSERPKLPPAPPLLNPMIWKAPFVLPMMTVVFWAWGSFNSATYYINLIVQSVLLASPLKTALYFLPMIISGVILNLVPGFLLSKVAAQYLIFASTALTVLSPLLMALMNLSQGYWKWLFPIFCLLPAPDIAYATVTVQLSRSVPRSQQSAVGALFNVVTRITTAVSLAVISTAASSVTLRYANANSVPETEPLALMAGFRVASWLCVGWAVAALAISLLFLRNLGIVGRKEE